MASNDRQFAPLGTEATPAGWSLPRGLELIPKSVYADFDGTAAAGSFLPTLQIFSDSGHLLAEIPVSTSVAAGGSASVTWAPFLRASPQSGGVIAPPGPVVGWDAYASFAAGSVGFWPMPSAARLVVAVCVGAGGGGGAGAVGGSGTQGGSGGGGGAVTIAWHDAQRLQSLYAGAVPINVGAAGKGGISGVSAPTNGGGTSFGIQIAGGGGGGGAGGVAGGGGGGLANASGSGAGLPTSAGYNANGFGPQSIPGVPPGSANPGSSEYGGSAGAAPNSIDKGFPGGNSLFGGPGGGSGGTYNTGALGATGGVGGKTGTYTATGGSGGGNGANGTLTGLWTGGGGAGGHAAASSTDVGQTGGKGAIGAGGGGGGSCNTGHQPGNGGDGGGGLLLIYVLG